MVIIKRYLNIKILRKLDIFSMATLSLSLFVMGFTESHKSRGTSATYNSVSVIVQVTKRRLRAGHQEETTCRSPGGGHVQVTRKGPLAGHQEKVTCSSPGGGHVQITRRRSRAGHQEEVTCRSRGGGHLQVTRRRPRQEVTYRSPGGDHLQVTRGEVTCRSS